MGGPAPSRKRAAKGRGSTPVPDITIQPAPAPAGPGNLQTQRAIGLRDDPLAPDVERRLAEEQRDLAKLGTPAPGEDRLVDVGGQDTDLDPFGPRDLFHVTVHAAGANGGIVSQTDYSIRMDATQRYGNVFTGPATGPDVGKVTDIEGVKHPAGLAPAKLVPLYPVLLTYRRQIELTDRDGRKVKVWVGSTMQFSYDTWEAQTAGRTPSLEILESLVGDVGLTFVELEGAGQVVGYKDIYAMSEATSIGAGVASVIGKLMNHQQLADARGLPMSFLMPRETAGSQFETLDAVLRRMDEVELARRAQLETVDFGGGGGRGGGTSLLKGPTQPGSAGGGFKLPTWLQGLLNAVGKAALLIGGIILVAALIAPLFGISVGLAALWIGASLLAGSFVNALIARIQEAMDEGVSNPFAVVGTAVADTFGAAAIYEAATDQSLLTGRKLNRSEEERWEAGFTGALTLGLTLFGMRSKPRRAAEPPGKAAPEPPASEPAPPRRPPPEDHPGMDLWTEGHDPSPQVVTRLRQARCSIGEQGVAFEGYPQRQGWAFIEGPSGAGGHNWNAPGFDGVAFRTRGPFELEIIDNKAFASQGNVSSSSALTRNLLKNLDDLSAQIADPAYNGVPQIAQVRNSVAATRAAVQNNTPLPQGVSLVVTNFGGQSSGITSTLQGLGITFRDIR